MARTIPICKAIAPCAAIVAPPAEAHHVSALKLCVRARALKIHALGASIDQTQPEIGEHLGDAYWAAGRRIDARHAWTAASAQAGSEATMRLDRKITGGF